MFRRWVLVSICLLLTVSVAAQESNCANLLRGTFDVVTDSCMLQAEDVLCHGNPTLQVTVNATVDEDLEFSSPGDVIPIRAIDTFSSSTESGTWGTSRINLHTYISNNMESVPATMVVIGDVILQNNGTEHITIETVDLTVTERQGANLRSQPTTDARLVTSLIQNTTVKASGKSADGVWVRVHPSQDQVAWVSTTVVSDGFESLPIVDANEEVDRLVLSFQEFDFQSAPRLANCGNSGLSGIILQTSEVTEFVINSVTIEINGTVFLQAQPENGMLISAVNGNATVIAFDETVNVVEGYVSRIPMELNDEGRLDSTEAPGIPLIYDYDTLLSLPLDLLPQDTALALDIYTLIAPRPASGESPIAGMALDAPCKFTVGESGSNIRSQPGTDGAIIATMSYRESAEPLARAIGSDGLPWWKLAESVWVRVNTTVTGGDCSTVPLIQYED